MKLIIEINNSENKPNEIQNIIKYLDTIDNVVYSPCGVVGNVDRRCYTIGNNQNEKDNPIVM